ncbi:glycosyltransferase family 39 protein [Streptomyces sp. NPDC006984]|uniref:glycosyltransferase family 39 protein n=1 Tax=Streptomyces sp. NPDC006984 TaxID=3155463 RepID=UPI0033F2E9E2
MSTASTPAAPDPGGAAAPAAEGASAATPPGTAAKAGHGRVRIPGRPWRGRAEDPAWARPALLVLLAATALLYLWNLDSSGYANSFYSAAVQAGSESWKAFFFGSSDAANSITVDKPPAALWPMALSVRLFGLGSWQILVPEVLMGVATVAVLYAAVRRRFTPAAGLIAGAVLALTPVAALMFRFNNPDALLALLMTVTVYCVLRALEKARTGWLLAAGAAVGLAFLTKTLQAFLILPPLAVVYAVCAPTRLRRRLGQLALAAAALLVSGGWWVAVVELWPASSRPYIGGSQGNSFLELTFGYNGFGRINGNEVGSVGGGGGPGGGGRWGETGLERLFAGNIGGQIAWLLPAALVLLAAGLVLTRTARRTDTARAAFLVWGGALLSTAAVFSFMAGIFHEYYTVALAPYIAALVGMGATMLWEERARLPWAVCLAGTVALTAWWSSRLLDRSEGYLTWLSPAVLVTGLLAAAGLTAVRLGRRVVVASAGLALAASLAGPTAYAATTVNSAHTGSLVTAGPAVSGSRGGPGGQGGPGGPGGQDGGGGAQPPGARGQGQDGGAGGQGQGPRGMLPPGQDGARPDGQGQDGTRQDGTRQDDGRRVGGAGTGGRGGTGGLLGGTRVSEEASSRLLQDAGSYTWVAAAVGAQNAASFQLATGEPVMPVGGFNGSDPSPTLEQFRDYVADGRIHWFIGGGEGSGRGGPGGGTSTEISSWVAENFTAVTVDGATFYDLSTPTAS